MNKIDVIIPSCKKDVDTLDLCIEAIKKNVKDVNRIIVVSREKLTDNAEFFAEEKLPYSIKDVGDIIGFHHKIFNYYSDLIQATAAMVIPDLSNNVLICDSDTIFLNPIEFIDDEGRALYCPSYDIPANVTHHPYLEHAEKMIPGLKKQTRYSGIVHHILLQRHILQEIYDKVEKRTGMPFWKATLTAATEDFECLPRKPKIENSPLRMTIYELYFNYVLKYHANDVSLRITKNILAYKGRMGVTKEEVHNFPSRTNLYGNVQILPKEEESRFSFDSFTESCKHISKRCKEEGWAAVTFQNHTRIGVKEHAKRNIKYMEELTE